MVGVGGRCTVRESVSRSRPSTSDVEVGAPTGACSLKSIGDVISVRWEDLDISCT